jgi:hypothetical protein
MDLAVLLVIDAIALMLATIVLTFFFFRDILKNKKKKTKGKS